MEFDELYATHGDSVCKAVEMLPLRTRVSYQAWYQASLISLDRLCRGAKWDPLNSDLFARTRGLLRANPEEVACFMNSLPEFIRLTSLKLHRFVTNVTDWVGHIGLLHR